MSAFYSTKFGMAAVFARVILFSYYLLSFRRAQQFYLRVSAWMIRMESDFNTTAGAKTAAQALKLDVNAYAALFLQAQA